MLTLWFIKTGGCGFCTSRQGGKKQPKKKIFKLTKISSYVLLDVEGSKLLSFKSVKDPVNGHQIELHNRVLGHLSYACLMFIRSLSSILTRHWFQATLSGIHFKQDATIFKLTQIWLTNLIACNILNSSLVFFFQFLTSPVCHSPHTDFWVEPCISC